MKRTLSLILIVLTVMGAIAANPAYAVKTPSKVANVRQTAASRSSVKIKWDSAEGKNLTYELCLYNSTISKTYEKITANSKSVTGLSSGTIYKVKVRAVSGSTKGSWSSEIKTATCCDDTTVRQTKAYEKYVKLSWTAVEGATDYRIYNKIATNAGNTYKLLASTDKTSAKVKLVSENYTSDYLALVVSPVLIVNGYCAENKISVLSKDCVLEYPKIIPAKANSPTYAAGKLSLSANSWVSGLKYAVYELDGKKVVSSNVSAKNSNKASVSFSPKKGVVYKAHARGYVNVDGVVSYGETSAMGYIAKAPTVSTKWNNGSLKILWTKIEGATGYNLKVANVAKSDDFFKIKNIKSNSYTLSTDDISDLNVNKSYEVTVKPYKSSAGLNSGKATTSRVEIIGHRGCMDEAPENTMVSHERAYKNGYDTTEADFWETESGDLIISHEKMLTQCGCDDTDVRTLTEKTIKNYPITKGKNLDDYPTQYLPTLEQLVKKVASYKMKLLLHMKDVNMTDAGLQKVYDILSKYEMLDKTVVLSSNTNGAKRIVKVKLAASFLYVPNSGDDIKKCIDFSARNKIGMMIFRYNEFMSKDYVEYAHENSVRIGCYNVNNKKDAGAMSNMGADFLITNNNYFK